MGEGACCIENSDASEEQRESTDAKDQIEEVAQKQSCAGGARLAIYRLRDVPVASEAHSDDWDVIVGNIGTVYSGKNRATARRIFEEYKQQVWRPENRAYREPVHLFQNGELYDEYDGATLENDER